MDASKHSLQQPNTTAPPPGSLSSSIDPMSRFVSIAAAALIAASSLLGTPGYPLAPGASQAKARMTPDEMVTIEIFKKSTPSVVNVTNLAVR
jgi:hypothetical protein